MDMVNLMFIMKINNHTYNTSINKWLIIFDIS